MVTTQSQAHDPRLADITICAECGQPARDLVLIEKVEADSPVPQGLVDEWLADLGLKSGQIIDVGVRLVRTRALCTLCAAQLPDA